MKNPQTLPDIDSVKKGIDELLLIDKWDKYKIKSSPKKFEKRFNQLFINKLGIIPHVIQFSNQKSIPFKFYRLRKKNKFMNERLFSEYSYPPNHIVKTIQRANIPYHPVFYCSDNPTTAVYETIRTDKELNSETVYYLSEWQLRKDVDVRLCPFLFGNVDEENPYKILSDMSFEKLKEQLKEYSEKEIEGFNAILQFLSHLFVFDNTYIVSSYIAHSNLYANHIYRPDIFIYPSSQTDRKSVNFAIHPNAVAEKLILERVFKLRVTGLDKERGSSTVTISYVGQNVDGSLRWTAVDNETEEGKKLITNIEYIFKR